MSKLARPSIEWTDLPQSDQAREVVVAKLNLLTASKKELSKEGYIFRPLTEQEIWKKQRCWKCAKPLKFWRPDHAHGSAGIDTDPDKEAHDRARILKSLSREPYHCFWHDGRLWAGKWDCCNGSMYSPGCFAEADHSPCNFDAIRDDWQYKYTPSQDTITNQLTQPTGAGPIERSVRRTPNVLRGSATVGRDVRAAVALDCEMGTSMIGTAPLIKLSVVDFITGEPLIDRLVIPDIDMLHYNTRWSGVTFADMRHATRSNQGIRGTDNARELLFRFIDNNTIIVMHGGSSDLNALRICHPHNKIIDTFLLEGWDPTVVKGMRKGLKETCERRCGITVQDARLSNGKQAGHDSLEDAMAAREIVIAWLTYIPH